jgi:hypothetical protein
LKTVPFPSGNYLKKETQKNLILTILCDVTLLVIILISTPRLPTRIDVGDFDTSLALTAIFPTLGIYYYLKKYQNCRQGMKGEKRVRQFLESKLNDSYYLINDIEYINDRGSKENIDHIVLGPNGIFAIETKDYRGKITCKGSYWAVPFPFGRSPSSQAKGSAYWVKRAIDASRALENLSVWVDPIVVFSNPDAELETIDPEVEVVKLESLVDSITSINRYSFSPDQLKAIVDGILKKARMQMNK